MPTSSDDIERNSQTKKNLLSTFKICMYADTRPAGRIYNSGNKKMPLNRKCSFPVHESGPGTTQEDRVKPFWDLFPPRHAFIRRMDACHSRRARSVFALYIEKLKKIEEQLCFVTSYPPPRQRPGSPGVSGDPVGLKKGTTTSIRSDLDRQADICGDWNCKLRDYVQPEAGQCSSGLMVKSVVAFNAVICRWVDGHPVSAFGFGFLRDARQRS